MELDNQDSEKILDTAAFPKKNGIIKQFELYFPVFDVNFMLLIIMIFIE